MTTTTSFDGPTLRAIRESMGYPLRRIARTAGMSHGHLSKVERGEYGRPVTPAIMSAYERVTGVTLREAAAAIAEQDQTKLGRRTRKLRVWRPGEMPDIRRKNYNAAICAMSVGGTLGEPYGRLLDSTGRPLIPAPPDEIDITQLEDLTTLITGLDLRYGGGLISQFAKALLRWAAPMLDLVADPASDIAWLHRAVAALTLRTAWAAFDSAAHEAARSLFRMAIYTAVRGGDANLRVHILAEAAAQHNAVGYPEDALEIIRVADGDERAAPQVRIVLQAVKARAQAALGETDACLRSIEIIETVQTGLAGESDPPGWVATVAGPDQVDAAIGHALATLAVNTGDPGVAEQATQRLTRAVDGFDTTVHARAHALCAAQLAMLHLTGERPDLDQAAAWGRLALIAATTIRSARLNREFVRIRTLAARHPDQVDAKALVEEIDAATGRAGDGDV
jgi:transcriptional regulator with XRE-family HTH domain